MAREAAKGNGLKAKRRERGRASDTLELLTDVLVIGGGPAGAWAALTARASGCEVVLADKGYLGTSGATAPTNTETWCVPPGKVREDAVARHDAKTGGHADTRHVDRVLDAAHRGLTTLADWRYPFPQRPDGGPYLGNLRGPDYMRFLRRRVIGAGVQVLDHHPALELLADGDGVGGACGVDRQKGNGWSARASAVVLATGGCAFGERFLGATGLTGDGYLMAVEVGATLSGMEMSSQYAAALAGSSLNKGMPFRFATFYDARGRELGDPGEDRQVFIASAMEHGRVYACLDKAGPEVRDWLRRGQPNCLLPFDRSGIDPFADRFEVTLRCEGTVRGVGGIRLVSDACETEVAGLFAAGDVASREDLNGAITGGGGPNASWAIASGSWAGSAAGGFAKRFRAGRDSRRLARAGGAGVRAGGGTGVRRGGRACRICGRIWSRGPGIGSRTRRVAAARPELLPHRRGTGSLAISPRRAVGCRARSARRRCGKVGKRNRAGSRGGSHAGDRPLGAGQCDRAPGEPRYGPPIRRSACCPAHPRARGGPCRDRWVRRRP